MPRTFTLAGAFPRGEALVKATWNFDKGLIPQADLDRARLEQAHRVIELQQRLGYAPITNGLLGWQDLFRPVAESTPGFAVGGLQRLFETNKFYRQPVLQGPLPAEPAALAGYVTEALPNRTPWKAILPSPYWMAAATQDETGQGHAHLTLALAGLLNKVARQLERRGADHVQFNDALLLYEDTPDLDLAQRAYARLLEGLRVPTTLSFPNGDAATHLDWLLRLPSTAIGIDFVETPTEELPKRPTTKHIQAHLVDSQESHLETRLDLERIVQQIEGRLEPPQLTLTHTWDLDFVSEEVATRKLETLATLAPPKDVVAR